MAEPLQTPSRSAWLRTMARWMKAWAESVLAEDARAPASGAPRPESMDSTRVGLTAAPAPLAEAPREATLESLEARWLRDVEARSRIPVGDWVARVKREAPPLAGAGVPREHRVTPRDSSLSEEVGTGRGPLPPVARPPVARPPVAWPPVSEARPSARPMASAVGRFLARAREGVPPEGARDALAPESPPAPVPASGRERLAVPEPEPAQRGAWGVGPERAAAFRAPPATPARPSSRSAPRPPAAPPRPHDGGSADTEAPVPRAPWSEPFAFADKASARAPSPPLYVVSPQRREAPGAPVPERTLPSSSPPRFRLLFLDGNPVSAQEPRRGRDSLPAEAGGWDGAQSPLPWRRRESEPRSTDGAPMAGAANPWPELPPAPPQDGAEALVELRQWERRRRLDREQRGE